MSSTSSIRFDGTFRNIPMWNFNQHQALSPEAFEKLADEGSYIPSP